MLLIRTRNLCTGQEKTVLLQIHLQVQQPRSSFPQPVDQQIGFEYVYPAKNIFMYIIFKIKGIGMSRRTHAPLGST